MRTEDDMGEAVHVDSLRGARERQIADARFREAANSAPAPVWMTDADGGVEFVNRAFEEFAGAPASRLVGGAWLSYLHPDDLQHVIERRTAAWGAGHAPYVFEARFRRADGAWRWMEVSSRPRHDGEGCFLGYVGLAVDRTSAIEAEATLRGSEQRFVRFMQNLPGLAWIKDREGRYVYVNDAFLGALGKSRGEICGRTDFELFASDVAARARANDLRALTGESGVQSAELMTYPDRGERRVLINRFAIPGSEGAMLGAIAIDVTERTRGEEARRQLTAIVESSSDAIVSKDLNGVIVSWNSAAERLFGYTADEAVGRPVTLIIPEDHRSEEPDILRRIRAGERVEHFETVRQRKDGSRVDVSLTISPVKDEQGRIVGASKIARDVTEQKRAARALQESEQRYRALVDGLRDAIVWERDPDTLRFTFVSGAAETLLGYPARRWLEEENFWVEHIHADDRPAVLSQSLRELHPGGSLECEYRMVAADGRIVWLRQRAYVNEADVRGRLVRGLMVDFTEAKQHEEALKARQAELDLVASMTSASLVRCSHAGRYLFINRAAAELAGRPPQEIVGRSLQEVLGDKAYAAVLPYVERVKRGETVHFETEVPFPTGVRWMHATYTPDIDEAGRVQGWFASGMDITARKRAEEHRKLLIDELNHRVRNTLAVVQGIAHQTLKGDMPVEQARAAFEGRLLALAKAHGLLTRSNWESAEMADVVAEAIHAGLPARERIVAAGPPVTLAPKQA